MYINIIYYLEILQKFGSVFTGVLKIFIMYIKLIQFL